LTLLPVAPTACLHKAGCNEPCSVGIAGQSTDALPEPGNGSIRNSYNQNIHLRPGFFL
jgi:hypothetical protein